MAFYRSHILVSVDPECVSKGAHDIIDQLNDELIHRGLIDEVQVLETSRIGDPALYGPDMMVYPEGVHYARVKSKDIPFLVEEHFLKGRVVESLRAEIKSFSDEELGAPMPKEVRVVLRNCGKIDPTNIEDYLAEDGYMGLAKALSMTPDEVIDTVMQSGLRGRGGAGFPAAKKWQLARAAKGEPKYILCNADEGDPGAFMNRRVLESDPHSVIEGMIIGAYAIGAERGYVYCRAEYPIAVRTLNIAINQARELGLLGYNIMDSGFSFDLEVRQGAGAFVCGEETALIASVEGARGEPRNRPPFPAQKGLWGKPSNINNVETYANVPQIILNGPEWFAGMGTEKSKGTKTFALAGDLNHTGLIEVPFGITLREIVYDVGGGIKDGKGFKAIQTGGPMGGCIPESMLDLNVDYETLAAAGSIMGSGGMIVIDEESCMVDVARYFLTFTENESCGKCVPCRMGTQHLLRILTEITKGNGTADDIDTLRLIGDTVKKCSLCGLGQTAPNPVLTTLRYFEDEYRAHVEQHKCKAGVCRDLITFHIDADKCTGCMACARACPVSAITGEKKKPHVIDQELCIRCGSCRQACKFDSVVVE